MFNIGNLVKLKGDKFNLVMTVVASNHEYIKCAWFVESILHEAAFNMEALTLHTHEPNIRYGERNENKILRPDDDDILESNQDKKLFINLPPDDLEGHEHDAVIRLANVAGLHKVSSF